MWGGSCGVVCMSTKRGKARFAPFSLFCHSRRSLCFCVVWWPPQRGTATPPKPSPSASFDRPRGVAGPAWWWWWAPLYAPTHQHRPTQSRRPIGFGDRCDACMQNAACPRAQSKPKAHTPHDGIPNTGTAQGKREGCCGWIATGRRPSRRSTTTRT